MSAFAWTFWRFGWARRNTTPDLRHWRRLAWRLWIFRSKYSPAVESKIGDLVLELAALIRKPGGPRTEEVRQFIRANAHVGDFKKLAITLIMLAEADVVS